MPDELYAGHAQFILGEGVVWANRLSIHDVPCVIFDRLPGREKKAQGDGRLTPCRSRRIALTSHMSSACFVMSRHKQDHSGLRLRTRKRAATTIWMTSQFRVALNFVSVGFRV